MRSWNTPVVTIADALAIVRKQQQTGQLKQSMQSYGQILRANPRHSDAHQGLALVLYQMGQADAAQDALLQAISLNPTVAPYHYNLGLIYYHQLRYVEALPHLQQALTLKPNYTQALYTLGHLLLSQEKTEAARPYFQQVLTLEPNRADAHYQLGIIWEKEYAWAEAAASFRQAIALQPNWAEAQLYLGRAYHNQDDLQAALPHYQQALTLNPNLAPGYINLGYVAQEQGNLTDAIAYFQKALKLDPQHVQGHFNYATAQLMNGNFDIGWQEYEWRWQLPSQIADIRDVRQPRWDGSPLGQKTILLYSEQGLGDTLQFIRYAALVKAQGGLVIVQCQAPLKELLSSCPGVDQVVALGEPLPPFDVYAPLLSLPGIFKTQLDTIPQEIPYLAIPEMPTTNKITELLGQLTTERRKVGFVWSAKLTPMTARLDLQRFCPLEQFSVLFGQSDLTFCSLYKGERNAELVPYRDQVLDLGVHFADFRDTAYALGQMNLVITVDTSVAHLAGALGKPTWILLPFSADWRWLRDREDSPWYPHMRLFRQSTSGDWHTVLTKIAAALQKSFVAKRSIA